MPYNVLMPSKITHHTPAESALKCGKILTKTSAPVLNLDKMRISQSAMHTDMKIKTAEFVTYDREQYYSITICMVFYSSL